MTFLLDGFRFGSVVVPSGTDAFAYTGAYEEFVVPADVYVIQVDAYGAEGGTESIGTTLKGKGGRVQCNVAVVPGETLRVYVGGAGTNGTSGASTAGGFNGGGIGGGAGGSGGGATDVRRSPYGLIDRLVVAPGGAGAGANNGQITTGGGGDGGTPSGVNGQNGIGANTAGGGSGSDIGGGSGGTNATPGTLGLGGDAGHSAGWTRGGGGGGGGRYGGGGGGGTNAGGTAGGGGGGGSGKSTGFNETLTSGVRSGAGQAEIRWGDDIVAGGSDSATYIEDGWYSYDYNGGSGSDNVFYQAVETAGPVFSVDDSGWRIDTPEDPDSILALLRYQQWGGTPEAPTTSTGNPINLLGATISFELRGTGLDLKGAHATFWVVKGGQRWHYMVDFPTIAEGVWTPFSVTISLTPDSVTDWHNSWAVDPVTLSGTMAEVHSYGIGFVGFSSEPTGQLDMRNWRVVLP